MRKFVVKFTDPAADVYSDKKFHFVCGAQTKDWDTIFLCIYILDSFMPFWHIIQCFFPKQWPKRAVRSSLDTKAAEPRLMTVFLWDFYTQTETLQYINRL